jgi:hypothetical protein
MRSHVSEMSDLAVANDMILSTKQCGQSDPLAVALVNALSLAGEFPELVQLIVDYCWHRVPSVFSTRKAEWVSTLSFAGHIDGHFRIRATIKTEISLTISTSPRDSCVLLSLTMMPGMMVEGSFRWKSISDNWSPFVCASAINSSGSRELVCIDRVWTVFHSISTCEWRLLPERDASPIQVGTGLYLHCPICKRSSATHPDVRNSRTWLRCQDHGSWKLIRRLYYLPDLSMTVHSADTVICEQSPDTSDTEVSALHGVVLETLTSLPAPTPTSPPNTTATATPPVLTSINTHGGIDSKTIALGHHARLTVASTNSAAFAPPSTLAAQAPLSATIARTVLAQGGVVNVIDSTNSYSSIVVAGGNNCTISL